MCFQVCVQYSMSPYKNFQANHCNADYFYSLHPALPGPAQCKSCENITNHKANSELPRTLPAQLSPFFLTDWDPWLATVGLDQRIDHEISVWLSRLSIWLQCGRPGFNPWVGKIPWRRKWQSTPVLLPGKSHGQRSPVGYSPWGGKESNMTEQLHFHFSASEKEMASHSSALA